MKTITITSIIVLLFFAGCKSSCDFKYVVQQGNIDFYTNEITHLDKNCIITDDNVTICGTYSIRNNPSSDACGTLKKIMQIKG